ncbi:MAG: stage 0 sporulation family protein [Armatimonadota bacterium]|nr:stage 0 sporulation family protein [Armatimonadota bacterium]
MSDDDSTRDQEVDLEVGVSFRHNPKVYSFASSGYRLSIGDKVLVHTEKGVDIGEVREIRGRIPPERAEELMPVVRKATPDDLEHVTEQERREEQALKICAEKIEEHGLPMKLIEASLSFDNTRLVFFFSADGRVDFRELVRDLAKTFRMRIELRQIGVRDEAKLLGGLGPCGRRLCCKTFMRDFEPVGIRVAKDQDLALNPNKISGLCDRLMCCLLFERDTYLELTEKLPEKGDRVRTAQGAGTVRDVAVLKEQLTVELEGGSEVTVPASEVEPCEGDSPGGDADSGARRQSDAKGRQSGEEKGGRSGSREARTGGDGGGGGARRGRSSRGGGRRRSGSNGGRHDGGRS